jgi:hypothetical protein
MTDVLRGRLLLSLGLGAALPACGFHGSCDNPPRVTTVSLDALAGDSGRDTDAVDTDATDTDAPDTDAADTDIPACPTDAYAVEELLLAGGDVECSPDSPRLTAQTGRDCTYEYVCYICCGYGRPYLDGAGAPVMAEGRKAAGWASAPGRPDVAALSAAERAVIGAYWLENARAEHSSVAGFHRFALDLLAHGAPPELIARVHQAAAQELRHALDAFTLAGAYLGYPVGPAPMDLGGHARIAASLAELAAWTARDGAIGETMAAYLADRALAGTTDPGVRAVLATVVRDETEHAELAWATLRWALEVGGDDVRDAIRAVFTRLCDPQPHAIDWTPALAAHGLASPEREQADARACVDEVILPVLRAMLDARAAA